MRRSKYCRGAIIPSMADAVNEIIAGRYIYLGHKVQHHAWALNMSVLTIWQYVRNSNAYYAVAREDMAPSVDSDFREVDQ